MSELDTFKEITIGRSKTTIKTDPDREEVLRTLISMSDNITEADECIIAYDESFEIPLNANSMETFDVFSAKYDFVRNIHLLGVANTVPIMPEDLKDDADMDDDIVAQYWALLSNLIS